MSNPFKIHFFIPNSKLVLDFWFPRISPFFSACSLFKTHECVMNLGMCSIANDCNIIQHALYSDMKLFLSHLQSQTSTDISKVEFRWCVHSCIFIDSNLYKFIAIDTRKCNAQKTQSKLFSFRVFVAFWATKKRIEMKFLCHKWIFYVQMHKILLREWLMTNQWRISLNLAT